MLREAADEFLCPLGLALAAALPPGAAPRPRAGFALAPRGRAALESGAVRGAARDALAALAQGGVARAALQRARARRGAARCSSSATAWSARARVGRVAGRAPADAALRGARAGRRSSTPRSPRSRARRARPRCCASWRSAARRRSRRSRRPSTRACCARWRARPGASSRSAARRATSSARSPRPTTRVELSPDQARALEPIAAAVRARRARDLPAPRRHRQRQDRGLPARGRRRAAPRAARRWCSCPRSRSRTRSWRGCARASATRSRCCTAALRPAERSLQWQRLHAGATPIAVGARSALFAPLENLGVIVIDEEHDGAYKNEEGFRYHARDLAARRAAQRRLPARARLGDARARDALRRRAAASCTRLSLPRRIAGRPLPAVEIVDLARERADLPRGRKLVLSRALRRAMARDARRGRPDDPVPQPARLLDARAVLRVRPRRALPALRHRARLPRAATRAALPLLRAPAPPPDACRGCGAPDTALLGLGTERLEEEVRAAFPAARIARLDRDTAARRGHAQRVLRELRARRLDVLVGTQMVAKGHDFPGVRLVGVVAADVGLHLPDFRAAERTFQLLTQVAGRAGRDATPGPCRDPDLRARALRDPPGARRTTTRPSTPRSWRTAPRSAPALPAPRAGAVQQRGRGGRAARRGDAGARRGRRPPPAPTTTRASAPRPRRSRGCATATAVQLLLTGGEVVGAARRASRSPRRRASCARGVQASVDVDPWSML